MKSQGRIALHHGCKQQETASEDPSPDYPTNHVPFPTPAPVIILSDQVIVRVCSNRAAMSGFGGLH